MFESVDPRTALVAAGVGFLAGAVLTHQASLYSVRKANESSKDAWFVTSRAMQIVAKVTETFGKEDVTPEDIKSMLDFTDDELKFITSVIAAL